MSNQVANKFVIETWLDCYDSNPSPKFLTASYVDKNSIILLRYSIEYLLNPFISDDFIEYLRKYCRFDDTIINNLSELLLALDITLDLPLSINEEFVPYE